MPSAADLPSQIGATGGFAVRASIVHRVIGAAILLLVGWQIGSVVGPHNADARNAAIGVAAGAIAGYLLAPYLVARPYEALRRLVSRTPPGELLYGTVGLLLGLLAAALLAYPLSQLPGWFGHVLPAVTAGVLAYVGVSVMTMRDRDLTSWLRNRAAEQPDADSPPTSACLLDTSVIIDGRIADISHTGFLFGPLLVPRFVLHELQNIAGSADPLRRNRGRRGLEILNRMQKESPTPVSVCELDARDVADVDSKLVQLARERGYAVITNDFNLNRVAELQGVRVLNINELANAIKPVVLPGEEMAVRIIQEGKEVNQGVGYLDDGTMIVVENGRRFLHHQIQIVVTRVLQTVAGRMIFATPKSEGRD
jgi:uncharacterized protein YacL